MSYMFLYSALFLKDHFFDILAYSIIFNNLEVKKHKEIARQRSLVELDEGFRLSDAMYFVKNGIEVSYTLFNLIFFHKNLLMNEYLFSHIIIFVLS